MVDRVTVRYLREEGYRGQMKHIVEPYLRKYRRLGSFAGFDGTQVFYCVYAREDLGLASKGSIVISHGFSEFFEKYNEVAFYFLQAGYSVFIPEHRGHGRSERKVRNLEKVYVKSFSQYVRDLHIFVKQAVKPYGNEIYLFAHSMGGAIGAMYLEAYPDDFKKAVLSSPMIQMNVRGVSYPMAMKIAHVCRALGFGRAYAAGQGGFHRRPDFERSSCLSLERHLYAFGKRLGNQRCRTSGASYSWVSAAGQASAFIQDEANIARIKIPVLLFAAGREHMVNTDEICRFAGKLEDARLVWALDAKHEIFNAREPERLMFFDEIFAFLMEDGGNSN